MKLIDRSVGLFAGPMLVAIFLLGGCGDPPASPPEQLRGNLEVTGVMMPDSILADSIQITLDDVPLGWFANPHLCEDVLAGVHLVAVSAHLSVDSTIIEYSGARTDTVLPDTTIQRQFALLGLAPDFELYDLDSNLVSMSSLSGKVIMLYFFVST